MKTFTQDNKKGRLGGRPEIFICKRLLTLSGLVALLQVIVIDPFLAALRSSRKFTKAVTETHTYRTEGNREIAALRKSSGSDVLAEVLTGIQWINYCNTKRTLLLKQFLLQAHVPHIEPGIFTLRSSA